MPTKVCGCAKRKCVFSHLCAAYGRALVDIRDERLEAVAYLRSQAREHPELAAVFERTLSLIQSA